jgi:hypothetical protein
MMGDIDVNAMQRVLRTIGAAIRLRDYHEWETEVLHDEGTVLGVKSAGSGEWREIRPPQASERVRNALDEATRRIGILRAEAEVQPPPIRPAVRPRQSSYSRGPLSSSWR